MANESKQDVDVASANRDHPELETGLATVTAEPAAAGNKGPGAGKPKDITKLQVQKGCSRGLAGWLAQHRLSLAITSYQSGRIYLVGSV